MPTKLALALAIAALATVSTPVAFIPGDQAASATSGGGNLVPLW
jgi:hypothetical protein